MKSVALFLIVVLTIEGCDQQPDGIIDPSGRQPNLAAVVLTTPAINTDTILVGGQRNPLDNLILTIRFRVTVGIPATTLRAFHYVVTQSETGDAVASGDIAIPELEQWQLSTITNPVTLLKSFLLPIRRTEVGSYTVALSAFDVSGLESNVFLSPLTIMRLNRPPQISSLEAPDTLHLPAQDSVVFRFSLQAVDPDGTADIDNVRFTSIRPDGTPSSSGPIEMYDDGSFVDFGGYTSGDAVEADGVYSRSVQLKYDATKGNYLFSFVAIDRSGDSSNVITHSILVQ